MQFIIYHKNCVFSLFEVIFDTLPALIIILVKLDIFVIHNEFGCLVEEATFKHK